MKNNKNLEAELFKVIPIDEAKIQEHLHLCLGTDPSKVRYNVPKIAWLKDSDCVTDTECVYFKIYKVLQAKELVYMIEIEIRESKKTENGWSNGMMPAFVLPITLDAFVSTFSLPETTLKEFMTGRFNYNPRIIKNTKELMQDYASLVSF